MSKNLAMWTKLTVHPFIWSNKDFSVSSEDILCFNDVNYLAYSRFESTLKNLLNDDAKNLVVRGPMSKQIWVSLFRPMMGDCKIYFLDLSASDEIDVVSEIEKIEESTRDDKVLVVLSNFDKKIVSCQSQNSSYPQKLINDVDDCVEKTDKKRMKIVIHESSIYLHHLNKTNYQKYYLPKKLSFKLLSTIMYDLLSTKLQLHYCRRSEKEGRCSYQDTWMLVDKMIYPQGDCTTLVKQLNDVQKIYDFVYDYVCSIVVRACSIDGTRDTNPLKSLKKLQSMYSYYINECEEIDLRCRERYNSSDDDSKEYESEVITEEEDENENDCHEIVIEIGHKCACKDTCERRIE